MKKAALRIPALADMTLKSVSKDPELLNVICGIDSEELKQLEFIGDRVLGMLMTDFIGPIETAFDLTEAVRVRVTNQALAMTFHRAGLGRVFISSSPAIDNKRYADVIERIIGLAYRRGGITAARRIVREVFNLGKQIPTVVERLTEAPKADGWVDAIITHSTPRVGPGGFATILGQAKRYGIGLKACAAAGISATDTLVQIKVVNNVITHIRKATSESGDSECN